MPNPTASKTTNSARVWRLFVTFAWLSACDRTEGPSVREDARARAAYERADAPASDVNLPVTPQAAAAPSGPLVVFLGDSLAAGLHLRADQAFPAVLARRLGAEGTPFRLLNAGVSGDTTAGGARRVDWVLKQKPEIVVIELGANDGMRGVPLPEIEANLRTIVVKIRASGARPLLLGVRLPPSYGAEYASGFDAIYPRLARELDLPFAPFFMDGVAGVAELNLPDGIHPTAEGHARLAARLEEPLQQLVTDKTVSGTPTPQ